MTLKKAEMAKTLKNGLSMIKTNPLNHNWSHFAILSGLTLHQFQKKLLLSLETTQGGIKFNCYLAFLGRLRKTWLKSHAYVIKTGFCLSVCLLQLNVPTITK